jgi:leader peptidase (prepilin peptidase) / N-methyltransferase
VPESVRGMVDEESSAPLEAATDDEVSPDWQPILRRWQIPIGLCTVALLAGIVVRLGLHLSTLPVLAFAVTSVALAVIDFAILRLPNALTAPTAVLAVAACVAQALAEHNTHLLTREAEGAAGVAGFYALLHVLSRGGLGLGDVKLGAIAGLVLASRDWQHVFDGTFLAYLCTLAIAIVLMIRRRKKFPYGPGLVAGTIIVLLV